MKVLKLLKKKIGESCLKQFYTTRNGFWIKTSKHLSIKESVAQDTFSCEHHGRIIKTVFKMSSYKQLIVAVWIVKVTHKATYTEEPEVLEVSHQMIGTVCIVL